MHGCVVAGERCDLSAEDVIDRCLAEAVNGALSSGA
jgi:hypothetical protein